MILFNIIQNNESKSEDISEFLITNQYALQTHIDINHSTSSEKRTIRLYFITKALLYDEIEYALKTNYYSSEMVIYATPISHVNKEFGEELRKELKSI